MMFESPSWIRLPLRSCSRVRTACVLTVLFLALGYPSSFGQLVQTQLENLDGVGIEERLEDSLPNDLSFRNSDGKTVKLGDLLKPQRPLLLSLNYSDCPMLCRLQLNGLVDGLRDLKLEPGVDFDVVSVSIDPQETPVQSRQTKQHYLQAYGRPNTADGWHFLSGNKTSIDALADTVGFRYRYVPERKEYAHAAVTIAITPSGKISRYLYGVLYPPQTLKLALVEAGEGKIGTTIDRVLLFCFHYDATTGRYAPVAKQLMKLGAAGTLTLLAIGLLPVWFRRRTGFATRQPTADSTGKAFRVSDIRKADLEATAS